MNLLNLLTQEKHVAGIDISDSVVRIAFFRAQKKKRGKQVESSLRQGRESADSKSKVKSEEEDELILIEEPIAANIIADGVVVDVDLLGKTLKNIWTKAELGTDYAIVAIPDDKVYSRVFSFPKSVDGGRLTEAMRLAISFQLPMKTEDVYLDWERTGGTTSTNEILLSTVPQTVAQGYVAALDAAGIKTLALESHLAAIARAVKTTPGVTTLFSEKTPDGATIFALKDGILRFSRTFPLRFVSEDKIPHETEKIKGALMTDTKGEIAEQELIHAEIRDEYAGRTEITSPKSKWLVALGTAIRGRIPEGEDNLVSLLPIGTEEAYAYQRATTFATLLRNLVVGVSIFFIVAYLATYLFMISLTKNTTEQMTTITAGAVSPELAEKEQRVKDINALTETGAGFLAQMPTWDVVLTELVARTPSGVTISSFSAPAFTGGMSISGSAVNRTVLNSYKKILQDSPLLAEVDIPLTNLEKKDALPFTASFRLKDPSALYYK